VQDYLLFIDTETSGLPKNWNLPYSKEGNWPHGVQVSWLICTKDNHEVKREDHYINNNDFTITPKALTIHGITPEFLTQHGEPRKKVLQLLADDLNYYKPLVVGHFVELDYHITGADFYRAGMDNPMAKLQRFCTMLGSCMLVRNPRAQYLRLGQLYHLLFNKDLEKQHNSLADAEATAECFFELVKQGYITDRAIEKQETDRQQVAKTLLKGGCAIPVLFLFILSVLLYHCL
jgi:DNA polymerase-3 subunit epsilon